MIVKQHIPNFCSRLVSEEQNFNNLDELINIDFIKRWSKSKGFKRFSISKSLRNYHLMAEYNNGEFWVIGYLNGKVDLPERNENL